MAVVVVCSVTGSPGVTTSALVLALTWPREVLLVDADRTPSQAIESGYLRDRSWESRGLMAVAQEHRARGDLSRVVWDHSVPLAQSEGGPAPQRFLPGFAHPGAPDLFAPVWDDLGSTLSDLETAGVDVIVDAGRVGTGLPTGLVRHADSVMIASRSSLRAMASLRLTLPMVTEQVTESAPQAECGLLLIGPGRPYSEAEVTQHFGVPLLGTLPHDPEAAAVYSDGEPPARRHERSGLVRGGLSLAQRLSHRVGQRARAVAEASREAR